MWPLAGRPRAPRGKDLEVALARWRALPSDEAAAYDREVTVDASAVVPWITFGTNPGQGIPVDGRVPDPAGEADASARGSLEAALRYMGLRPGQALLGQKVDAVFIGSCTNGRLEDMREAARAMKGRKVTVRTLVVPGSHGVKRAAEAEGLDRVFREAGAEWREPGCSMCLAMNGDMLQPGQYCVDVEPELRGAPGARRADAARQPGDRGRRGGLGRGGRSPPPGGGL